jgi:imidazolonepropionase-like amidohydrolase
MLKNSSRHAALFIACLFLSCLAQLLFITHAQRNAIDTYAITNARIVTLSGPIIERGTIVIRNGLINAVGASVQAPPDARVIDAGGLTVYPGLIDSYTSLGMPQPSPSPLAGRGAGGGPNRAAQAAQTAPAFSAPNSSQPPGLQPEVLAESLIQPGEAGIEAERNAGITSALTIPREGIFVGQSAYINLAGETAQQMILRSPVAMHVGFTPLRTGGYPGSLMGVFAALRQMLLDAQRYQTAQAIYERSPRGLRRPEQDRSLAALIPVITREMPVVMYANTEREIRRALDLAQEFNLRVIIAGGAESWKVADRLRQQNVPVLLSLNFPRRTTAQATEADPDPLRVLRERVDAPKTAGRLAAARVNFAFQSGAMTSMTDFLSNVSKAIDNGLARDEALRALTIRPAEILGVANRLGTIETGKIANLTITRGDIFDRNSRITHVFIDGQPVDLKPVAATGGAGTGAAAGTWTLSVNLGEGNLSATLVLQQEGDRLRGSLQGELGTAQIASASASQSGELRFTAPVNVGGQTTEANFTGTINGNEMRGAVQIVGRASGTFTGTRPVGPTAAPPSRTPNSSSTVTGATTTSTPVAGADLSGNWTLAIMFGPNTVTGVLKLSQQGTTLTGTLQSPFGTTELSNGSTGPDGFRFTTIANVEGRTVEITVTGTTNGGEMRGLVSSEIGSTSFTGTRQP